MENILIILSSLLILLSVLPFVKNQHWVFRVPEFMKLQILTIQIPLIVLCAIYLHHSFWFWVLNFSQAFLAAYHLYILLRYTTIYRKKHHSDPAHRSETIKIISANVYQFNTDYPRFQELIRKHQPDIFITMESNAEWERANRILEEDYPYTQKMTLENTYGMHLYSKIPFEKSQFHFFVADDVPSIEAHFKTKHGDEYIVYGVHPPPPSPTEEATSKERDGDLLALGKRIKDDKTPCVVIGDFNTVAWSDTSILFRKTSELIDARVGRGILATFHARYWFFRVPLDLLFHSPEVFIGKLKTLENFGSDHFPILCEFSINASDKRQEDDIKTLEAGEEEEVDELIEEGIEEESDNREPEKRNFSQK